MQVKDERRKIEVEAKRKGVGEAEPLMISKTSERRTKELVAHMLGIEHTHRKQVNYIPLAGCVRGRAALFLSLAPGRACHN